MTQYRIAKVVYGNGHIEISLSLDHTQYLISSPMAIDFEIHPQLFELSDWSVVAAMNFSATPCVVCPGRLVYQQRDY